MSQAANVAFLEQLRRVLGHDSTETAFSQWRVDPSGDQLRAATAWLGSLPTALREHRLKARIREEFDPRAE